MISPGSFSVVDIARYSGGPESLVAIKQKCSTYVFHLTSYSGKLVAAPSESSVQLL